MPGSRRAATSPTGDAPVLPTPRLDRRCPAAAARSARSCLGDSRPTGINPVVERGEPGPVLTAMTPSGGHPGNAAGRRGTLGPRLLRRVAATASPTATPQSWAIPPPTLASHLRQPAALILAPPTHTRPESSTTAGKRPPQSLTRETTDHPPSRRAAHGTTTTCRQTPSSGRSPAATRPRGGPNCRKARAPPRRSPYPAGLTEARALCRSKMS